MSTYTPSRTIEALRYVAEYQIMTDGDPATVVTEMLTEGVGDVLKGFTIQAVHPGYSVSLVQFTADVPVVPEHHRMSREQITTFGTDTLNLVIGDTDVDVRWFYVTEGVNIRPFNACTWCDRRVLHYNACPNSPDICTDCCGED